MPLRPPRTHALARQRLPSCAETAAEAPRPGLAARGHRGGVLRHGALSSRPVRQGDDTGVDAVCTYTKEPSAPPLDRVGLYHQVSNKTAGITQLGPYSLDKDSLYVNGDLRSSLCLLCSPLPAFPSPAPSLSPAPAHHPLCLSSQVTTNSHSCPVSTLQQQQAALRRHQVPHAPLLPGTGCWGPGLSIPASSGELLRGHQGRVRRRAGWQDTSAFVHPQP